jgi:tetratricopeptide (TPR) repeat protein
VGYWRNSETLARHALASTTANAPMEVLLGNAMRGEGKVEEANQHFAEALSICPDSVPALSNMALALVRQGKLDEAIEDCQAALKIQPREPHVHYLLGNALFRQGQFAEAISEYNVVLQIDPGQLYAMNDLAWELATLSDGPLRDGPEAVRLAERACELSNYRVTLFVGTLGAAFAEAGRFDGAIKTAQKAIALAMTEKNQTLIQKNRELLELYQHQKAYHEPPGP